MSGQETGQLAEELDVISEGFAQAWSLHFHHDVASVAQLRGVNLSERCTSQRLLLEGSEQLVDSRAKLMLDAPLDFLVLHRRNTVLKVLELTHVGLGKKIRAR